MHGSTNLQGAQHRDEGDPGLPRLIIAALRDPGEGYNERLVEDGGDNDFGEEVVARYKPRDHKCDKGRVAGGLVLEVPQHLYKLHG